MTTVSDPALLSQLFQHADAGLALVDETGLLVEVNPAFAEALGSTVTALRGTKVASLLPSGSITGRERLPSEWHYSRDGRGARITARPIEGGRLVLTAIPASSPDAANRLLGLQESLSLAMQGGRLGVWTRDLRTGRVEWSRELEMIFGLEEGTFAKNEAAFFELVHPDDQAAVAQAVEGSIQTGRDYQVEFRFKKADGTEGWMDGRGRTVLDAAGRPVLLAGVGIDITEQKQAEEALKRSREQFQAAAYGSFDAFFLLVAARDESGKIVDFVFTDLNERGEQLIGIPRETAIGGRLLDLLPGNLDNGMFAKYVQVVETRVPVEEEFGDCAAGHSGIWIHQQTVPLQDGIAITCRDETVRKKHELEMQSLNQAASLLGSTLDLPLIYDRLQTLIAGILDCDNMLVSSYNPETNMVTCSYAWMEGERADLSIFPPVPLAPEGRGMQSRVIRTGEPLLINDVSEGRKRSDNSVYIDADGTVRDKPAEEKPYTQSVIMVPIKLEDRVTGVVQVMSNRLDAYTPEQMRLLEGMVNQMAAAVQNALLYEGLEQRVRDRTAELALAYAEMQGFTYSVSHDLRAPLRSIISAAMILIEDYGDQVDEHAQSELRRMAKAASKMGQLIDDLLQYSRLGRTEIDTRPVDLTALAAEIVENLSTRHPKPMEIEIEPGLEVRADPLLLRLALENLVDNAYKYAGSGGSGRMWIGRDDEGYFVRDNGIGFDPQYAQRIFEPFQRLVLDSEFPGTGIGLANVKRIIERHGGRVWAESRPGEGATFYFSLLADGKS